MADLEPAAFDEVIDEAKAEGNLSRANVARKIKGANETSHHREQRGATPPRLTKCR
jgi:hypothetical protein